jgi:Arc/MetJ family transcription regulator
MKRTNLVLDERLLEQATRLAGQKTYSRTVGLALEDFVRRMQARQILSLRGSGAWHVPAGHAVRGIAAGPGRVSRGD